MNERKNDRFELREPVSPESLVPDSPIEPWMIAAVAFFLLLILCLTIFFWKRRRPRAANALSVRQAAQKEAAAALENIGNIPTREAAVQCSWILRSYLATAANDPSLFETHEETLSRHDALKGFSTEARMTTQAGFRRLAALKYAPEIPDGAAANVVSESFALLKTLHQGFVA